MPRYGGAAKKQKKFPGVKEYLKFREPKLFEIIERSGAIGALVPRRRQTGLTFLMPDKKTIKKIDDFLHSDEAEKAMKIIFSLIIPMPLSTPQHWAKIKDDITNNLNKKIPVKEVNKDHVVLEGSVKATINKDFTVFDEYGNQKRGNVFIWNLSGDMDFLNFEDSQRKYVGKDIQKEVKGSNEHETNVNITQFIEESIQHEKKAIEQGSGQSYESHMLNIVCNFITCVKEHNNEEYLIYAKEAICPCPITSFFMIFGSHGEQGMFPSQFLMDCIPQLPSAVDKPVDCLMDFCREHSDVSDTGLLLSQPDKVADEREELIDSLITTANVYTTTANVLDIYNELDNNNKLGELVDVLPNALHKKYSSNEGLHLRRDEARYLIYSYMKHNVKASPGVPMIRSDEFEQMCLTLKDIFGPNYRIDTKGKSSDHRIIKKLDELDQEDKTNFNAIKDFIEKCFLYMGCFTGKVTIYGSDEEIDVNYEYEMARDVYGSYENNEITISASTMREIKNIANSRNIPELSRILSQLD